MAQTIVKPTGFFPSDTSWNYPSSAYDGNNNSYAEGSKTRGKLYFKTAIPYDEILGVKVFLRYKNPSGSALDCCNFWFGYGSSSVTQIGSKIKFEGINDKQIHETVIDLGLDSQITTIMNHKNALAIGAEATSSYFFQIYEIGLVIDYVAPSSVYVGENKVSAVYVGDTKASAVYVGTTKVL